MSRFRAALLATFFSLIIYLQYSLGMFHRLYVDALLINHSTVVVVYGADWCPACKAIEPILMRLEHAADIKVIHVNIDEGDQKYYNVVAPMIPQITVYHNFKTAAGMTYHGYFPDTIMSFVETFMLQDMEPEVLEYVLGQNDKDSTDI
jgi:thiol-disulfide isomerase/thioredoxin